MTSPKVSRVGRAKEHVTLASDLAASLRSELDAVSRVHWPSDRYAQDPVAYCREILGFEPWSRQQDILETILHEHWTTIRSGHKTGKSRILSAAALWWYCSYEDGRVLFSNATGKQLENINWSEVTGLYRKSGTCLACRKATPKGQRPPRPCPHSQIIDGDLLKTSYGGLTSGERKIVGVTSRNTEGAGGFSGEHLLIIIDEASSTEDPMFQAFVGNAAAQGAKLVMAGNPTKQSGPFFDSWNRNKSSFVGVHVTSLEAAVENVPGLASQEYCDMVREQDERGEESPFYQIRVMGNFPKRADSSIYGLEDIMAAQDLDRYKETKAEGRLVVSIDPAGAGGMGDESVFSVIRGLKAIEQVARRGLSPEAHVAMALELVHVQKPREKALICVDADGVGAKVARLLDEAAEEDSEPIEVIRVYLGQDAQDWANYDQVGDEAHELLARWLRHGGVFPVSPKLEQEMQIMTWTIVMRKRPPGAKREIEVRSGTRKKDVRAVLHRSPDHLDSLRVFAWGAHMRGVLSAPDVHGGNVPSSSGPEDGRDDRGSSGGIDPYAGSDAWGRR